MKFTPLSVAGAFVIAAERIEDERGYFARTFCIDEFAAQGLEAGLVQCSMSYNRRRGTLRGMHYQEPPHEETKLVRCTRGSAYDVVLDLRRASPTFGKWEAVELSAQNGLAVYVPKGCAHGFQTLGDDTEISYQMSEYFHPESAAGVRWNDPAFAIQWPLASPTVSERDRGYPAFSSAGNPLAQLGESE